MKLTSIPASLQTDFLVESFSNVQPEIRREGNNIVYPAFIRAENEYRYFDVTIPYTGQTLSDYDACALQSYAALRKHFYGDFAVQNEQILKGTFAAHQYAVRVAFPKASGEVIAAVERFTAIKAAFWSQADATCAAVGKTRADLPATFTAETMLSFAKTNGMTDAQISEYAAAFSVVSLNLLHNGRNWDELFE